MAREKHTRGLRPAVLPTKGRERQVEKILAALLGLGLGHLVLYLCLTADARSALQDLSARWAPEVLAQARKAGGMPEPGTAAYGPWLERYEIFEASKDQALHQRHESLMRWGMIVSFLIAAFILGSAVHRHARSTGRRTHSAGRRGAPVRLAPVLTHPSRRRYRRSA